VLAVPYWAAICSREIFAKASWKFLLPVSALAAGSPWLVLQLAGGAAGILYATKIFVILLFAIWIGAVQKPGEFLDLGVWALGSRAGFDIGLAAKLPLQFIASISDDLTHMKTALRIKG
jgi:energy-coupling factor transport system permease protein